MADYPLYQIAANVIHEVAGDLADASKAGGRGTPYFIVGNQVLSGAQPFSAFQAVIESQL